MQNQIYYQVLQLSILRRADAQHSRHIQFGEVWTNAFSVSWRVLILTDKKQYFMNTYLVYRVQAPHKCNYSIAKKNQELKTLNE